ncbi:hypothetical protein [Pseudomonas mosselii]|uniref:hypothetical protein n=1 Tax=Pseudomonas mosselii TaxID=78327 RepID=UPI0007805CA3|nr:hypothetical protein [Pseudomonas mosselii]MBC7204250.1 hypothetical protein [Pusillimonas sp.]ATB67631.1 hypothetical protein CLJ08_24670 [Pseudomonas mosselii]KXG82731.1 hypothetical protein AXZ07_10755 [Pseudomonas mosselii]MDH1530744.1 hypothetical protein [Pseudomonas mosselii]MEB5931268.1 hypothetical protein [Pseudomonas mosselii]
MYEVMLESVPDAALQAALKVIVATAQTLSDLSLSGDSEVQRGASLETLTQRLRVSSESVCLSLRLWEFNVSNKVSLPLVLLRVIKWEDRLDIELSFNSTPADDLHDIMQALHTYASGLAGRFSIPVFYGGMEPALDKDTRYFTNDMLGPL